MKRALLALVAVVLALAGGFRLLVSLRARPLSEALVARLVLAAKLPARTVVGEVESVEGTRCLEEALAALPGDGELPGCREVRLGQSSAAPQACHDAVAELSERARAVVRCGRAQTVEAAREPPFEQEEPFRRRAQAFGQAGWVLGLEASLLAGQGSAAEALGPCRDLVALVRDRILAETGAPMGVLVFQQALPGCARAVDAASAAEKRAFLEELTAVRREVPSLERVMLGFTALLELELMAPLLTPEQLSALPQGTATAALSGSSARPGLLLRERLAIAWPAIARRFETARATAALPGDHRAAFGALDAELVRLPHPPELELNRLAETAIAYAQLDAELELLSAAARLDAQGFDVGAPPALTGGPISLRPEGSALVLTPVDPALSTVQVRIHPDAR
ncbi:MAG: hypothetical protein K1X89_12600 [Myxococcaceae bacterium]|nr:hypothetical protein [Myxococcaceae bacterium]